MKKLIVVGIIILLVGISIPSTGINVENKSLRVRELITTSKAIDIEVSKIVNLKKLNNEDFISKGGIKICDEGWHPALAGNSRSDFLAGFEITIDEIDWYPGFWRSFDNGNSWEEIGALPELSGLMYLELDSNDNGFFGTFGYPSDDDGKIWLIYTDNSLEYIYWIDFDWSTYNFHLFESLSISCYTDEDESWNWGGIAGTCYNGYPVDDLEGCPILFYPKTGGSCTIEWLPVEGYLNADFAIDEITGMSYAVYDHETDADLLVRKDNFGVYDEDGSHPYMGAYFLGDTIAKISKPSMESHNDSVVIVAEVEDNIQCFYSNNGGTTTFQTTVVESATNPEVISTWDGEIFVCSYIKEGSLYRKISDDGGLNWKDEVQITDGTEDHGLGKSPDGVYAIWAGDGVYFDKVYSEIKPELKIMSIEGPIGVTATIKNIGDASATNISSKMKITGGKLGLINKTKYGFQEFLEVGEDLTAWLGIVLGYGKIKVVVSVNCEEGASDEEDMSGMQVFFLSLL